MPYHKRWTRYNDTPPRGYTEFGASAPQEKGRDTMTTSHKPGFPPSGDAAAWKAYEAGRSAANKRLIKPYQLAECAKASCLLLKQEGKACEHAWMRGYLDVIESYYGNREANEKLIPATPEKVLGFR